MSSAFDRVVVSHGNTATVRDAFDGHVIGEPAYHEGPIRAARFSADGRSYCTASRDGTVRVWDVASGYPLSEPLVFDPAPPGSSGGPAWDDDYLMHLGTPSIAGRRITFPDPEASTTREFAWDVSMPVGEAAARELASLATLVFGARLGARGAVESVLVPEAHELEGRFRDAAIAALAKRAVSRAASRSPTSSAASRSPSPSSR